VTSQDSNGNPVALATGEPEVRQASISVDQKQDFFVKEENGNVVEQVRPFLVFKCVFFLLNEDTTGFANLNNDLCLSNYMLVSLLLNLS
jgi:hypothetical protein